jgi:SAM-dependent methyltransferase
MYYADKTQLLGRLFGAPVEVAGNDLVVGDQRYPVIDDVIVTLPQEHRPSPPGATAATGEFAPDVQRSFGAEWREYSEILPEHQAEFDAYFDLVELDALRDDVVADLGCGMGRWSHFVAPTCANIVLVDFSDAIFVARRNLGDAPNAIFVMADVNALPFADDAFDFAFSLGVLHHLPVGALDAVRKLRRVSPRLLVYLYYALDNRPRYFRALLGAVSVVRRRTARITNERLRRGITNAITLGVYRPFVGIGKLAKRLGIRAHVPLADTYTGKSTGRIRQDVYDRFFTSIEQRYTRKEIVDELSEQFTRLEVSPGLPYWHFLCER